MNKKYFILTLLILAFLPGTLAALNDSLVLYADFNTGATANLCQGACTFFTNVGTSNTSGVGGGSGRLVNSAGGYYNSSAGLVPNSDLSYTFAVWVNSSSLANFGHVWSNVATTPYSRLFFQGNYTPTFESYNGATNPNAYAGSSINSNNTWYFYVSIINTTTDRALLYRNGVEVANVSYTSGAIFGSTRTVTWGRNGGAANGINATLDNIGVWHRALSQSEINTLYNSGAGCVYSGCIIPSQTLTISAVDAYNGTALTSFNASVTGTAEPISLLDKSGNGNTLTNNGATWNSTSNSYNFDGVDSTGNYMNLPFNINTSNTASAYFFDFLGYNKTSGAESYIYVDRSGGNALTISISTTNSRLFLNTWNTSGGSSGTSGNLSTNSYTFGSRASVLVILDPTTNTRQMYFNGELVLNQTFLNLGDSTATGKLGLSVGATNRYFNGTLYNARVWNRSLSSAEVAAVYANGSVTDGLVAFYDFSGYGSANYTTTNGAINTIFTVNNTLPANVTVTANNYFTKTYNNYNNTTLEALLNANYKIVYIRNSLTNNSITATCTWEGDTATANNFTLLLEEATNYTLSCKKEYYETKNTTITINSNVIQYIYLEPYKLHIQFSQAIRGILADIYNGTERQTITFNNTEIIKTIEELPLGKIEIAFSCIGENFLSSPCTNPLGNFSQFYEYINTGEPQTDTLYVQNSLNLPLHIRVNDRGGRPIQNVEVQLLTWNTTNNFTIGQNYNYVLIGQRITDNEGYVYFNVNGNFGNVIRIIASAEGFGTVFLTNLQIADVAPNSKAEPINIVLDNSQTSYEGGTTFYSQKITNTTNGQRVQGIVYDRQATSVRYTSTYRETYCDTTNAIILAQCGGGINKELTESSSMNGLYEFTIISGIDYNSSTTAKQECFTFTINEEKNYDYCIGINKVPIQREIAPTIEEQEATPLIKTVAIIALIIISAGIGIILKRTTAGFSTFMIGSIMISAIIPSFMLLGIVCAYYYAIKLIGKSQQG